MSDVIESSRRPQSAALRSAMFDAFEELQTAHAEYKDALAIAVDTELSSDGMLAIRPQGRNYARAVSLYSDAVMAWLIVVETNKANALELLRKTTTGGA